MLKLKTHLVFSLSLLLSNLNAQTCIINTANCSASAVNSCLSGSATTISVTNCAITGGTYSIPNNKIITVQLNSATDNIAGNWVGGNPNSGIIINGIFLENKQIVQPNLSILNTVYGGSLAAFAASLPVDLVQFKVTSAQNAANLKWKTASERNHAGFVIEWSTDAIQWEAIGTVRSENPNSTSEKNYHFTHGAPARGNNYYRLAQKDLDGAVVRSFIQQTKLSKGAAFDLVLTPNPASESFTLLSNDESEEVFAYQIYSSVGTILDSGSTVFGASVATGHLPSGLYRLVLSAETGFIHKTFIVQN
jgi:hypothetical protein